MVMRSLFFFLGFNICQLFLYVHSFVPYEHQGSWPELLYYQSIGVYSVGKVRKFVSLNQMFSMVWPWRFPEFKVVPSVYSCFIKA